MSNNILYERDLTITELREELKLVEYQKNFYAAMHQYDAYNGCKVTAESIKREIERKEQARG